MSAFSNGGKRAIVVGDVVELKPTWGRPLDLHEDGRRWGWRSGKGDPVGVLRHNEKATTVAADYDRSYFKIVTEAGVTGWAVVDALQVVKEGDGG